MLINSRLKNRLKQVGLTQNELCKKIDFTPQGLKRAIDNKTLSVGTLEDMSRILTVPMSFWFDDKENEHKGSSVHEVFRVLEKIVSKEMNKD